MADPKSARALEPSASAPAISHPITMSMPFSRQTPSVPEKVASPSPPTTLSDCHGHAGRFQWGGVGRDPVWAIDSTTLPLRLAFRRDSPTHGLIEPTDIMSLAEFQSELAMTRSDWKQVDFGAVP